MKAAVSYHIYAYQQASHLFRLRLRLENPAPQGQLLRLPAWIPGSYMIRDFARHIVSISARGPDGAVSLVKRDNHSWQAAACSDWLEVEYEVYAFDLSVRGAYLDGERAFFNASSLCVAAAGFESVQHEIEIAPLASAPGWRVATGLAPLQVDAAGFGRYRADSYDALIDHPFEIGDFAEVSFTACAVPHRFVVAGRYRHADLARLARDAQRICEYQIRLFGTPAPFADYVFMLFVGGGVYGGLEHRNSTALMVDRDDLPRLDDEELPDGYLQLLGLISHEYFHSWNVKRIKPAAFVPYDLSRENHTRLLWAFEGVTSYYDDLTLVRCGLIDKKRYLDLLAKTVTAVQRGSGRLKQTLEASSFDAWTKFYRQDENSPNAIVSYYSKGALVALALDLLIRRDSGGRHSLDDVMRALWQRERATGAGLEEDEWERMAAVVTGLPLGDFFQLALRSTQELPLAPLLASQGVQMVLTPASSSTDRGGCPDALTSSPARVSLGVKSAAEPAGVRLLQVFDGGAAQQAGLSGGDLVLALDGVRVNDLEHRLAAYRAGDRVQVHAFRRDELMIFEVELQNAPADTCRLLLAEGGGGWLEHLGQDVWERQDT